MKQNITLRLERDLIKKAKILAAQKESSITRLLSEHLEKLICHEEGYQAAQKKALKYLDVGFSMGGKQIPRRDTLHER